MDKELQDHLFLLCSTFAVQTITRRYNYIGYPYKTAAEGFFKQLTSSFTEEYKLIHCQCCQTDFTHLRNLLSGYWLKIRF